MLPKYFPLFPEQASKLAFHVDALYFFILGVTIFFTTLVAVLILIFGIKYRHDKHPVPHQIEGSVTLEIFWSAVPLGIAMVIFTWGAILFIQQNRPPRGSLDVYGIGKQWMWKFQHPGGQREINELHVPVGRPVRVTLISQDVLHSFYVPAFRTQMEAIPGRYTTTWFEPTKPGTYHLFCNEYCGTKHSGMVGDVIAMEPGDYEQWLRGTGAFGSLATEGQKVFARMGCVTCHRGDNEARGPNLFRLYGTQVRLQGGQTVLADSGYIRESILSPSSKIVYGYQNIMPTFQGQLNEEELIQLVEYIKSLDNAGQLHQTITNTQPEPPVNLQKMQQGIDVTKPGNNMIPGPTSHSEQMQTVPKPQPNAPQSNGQKQPGKSQ